MVLTLFSILVALVIGKMAQYFYHKYHVLIWIAVAIAIVLMVELFMTVFDKISFVPIFLLFRW